MVRIWEKYLTQNDPNHAKLWATLGVIFDATIIGVLVLTLFIHSCEICYTTSSISGVYSSCAKTTDIFEHGYPFMNLIHPNTTHVAVTYPAGYNQSVQP
jgi:hypothetical protein